MPTDQQRREECRRAVRAYLAERARLSMGIGAITRGLCREGGFSEEEVADALAYLVSRRHVTESPDPDGATPYFQISAEGVLAHERG